MNPKNPLFVVNFWWFISLSIWVACDHLWIACNDPWKNSSSVVMDRDFDSGGGGFGKFFSCFSDVFFITSVGEANKLPIYLGFSKYGVKSGYVLIDGDQIVREQNSSSCGCCLSIFKAPYSNSLKTRSPRYSPWTCLQCLHVFLCLPPRFCSVSVSCCWTSLKAKNIKRRVVWHLKSVSCIGGKKRTTWSHCMRDRSPNHICMVCCWSSFIAHMIRTKKSSRLKVKNELQMKQNEEEEEEEEEEEMKKKKKKKEMKKKKKKQRKKMKKLVKDDKLKKMKLKLNASPPPFEKYLLSLSLHMLCFVLVLV